MYDPQINDYVKWNDIEGWVYLKSEHYITIEISAKPKPYCDLASRQEIHKKNSLLCSMFPLQFL